MGENHSVPSLVSYLGNDIAFWWRRGVGILNGSRGLLSEFSKEGETISEDCPFVREKKTGSGNLISGVGTDVSLCGR